MVDRVQCTLGSPRCVSRSFSSSVRFLQKAPHWERLAFVLNHKHCLMALQRLNFHLHIWSAYTMCAWFAAWCDVWRVQRCCSTAICWKQWLNFCWFLWPPTCLTSDLKSTFSFTLLLLTVLLFIYLFRVCGRGIILAGDVVCLRSTQTSSRLAPAATTFATLKVSQSSFLPHSDARFERQQVVFTRSLCLLSYFVLRNNWRVYLMNYLGDWKLVESNLKGTFVGPRSRWHQ